MTDRFDRASWEERWARVQGKRRAPSAHLVQTASGLTPGLALDAGAGNGTQTLWLAERGWQVDALDFAATALQDGAAAAAKQGLADSIRWLQADLSEWSPAPERYDFLVAEERPHASGSGVDAVVRAVRPR